MKDFDRSLRIADFIRDELAEIIRSDMRDPRVGIIGVNDVTVSKDLAYADIHISCLHANTKEDKLTVVGVLNKASGFFRSQLSKRHSMRTTPKLRFYYDDILEKGPELESLIESAVQADEARRVHIGDLE